MSGRIIEQSGAPAPYRLKRGPSSHSAPPCNTPYRWITVRFRTLRRPRGAMVGVVTLDRRLPVILLVEDEALVRMLAAEVLSEAGFTIIESGSAEEALAVLQTRPNVRVLFTDVNMPGALDGLGLAQIVHERVPEVGILIGSGRIRPRSRELPPGGRFIPKPYAPSALTEAVSALVQG